MYFIKKRVTQGGVNIQDKDYETQKRNAKVYKSYILRVRRDSELAELLAQHGENGTTSVNFIITAALCNFFKCKLPHREYNIYKREKLI